MQAVLPRLRRSPLARRLLMVMAVLGPGFITASAGNDVGGIAQYSAAGAQFGYSLIWIMVPLAVALIVVQEMATRMGCVTGKGLASLMRETFGVRISFLAMVALFLINTLLAATEFAGIAAASEIFGVSRYIAVPGALVIVFLLVLRLESKIVERIFVGFSLIYLTYIASAVVAHPNWSDVARGFVPSFHWQTAGWLVAVVGLIGTTISPYMQFFLQSAVVEKDMRPEDLGLARVDVVNGSLLAIALAAFMIVANGATIFIANQHGGHFNPQQAADFAEALRPLAGKFAETIFAFGILNAGIFTATVLPLSTAYIVCEAFGFEAAIDRKFSEAPVFFSLFAIGLTIGAAVVLIPGIPLLQMILFAQDLQGVLLPAELVLMLIIVNRKSVMGAHTNSPLANTIAWTTVVIIGILSVIYVVGQFFPQLLGGG
ncbi:MAG: divalent metal cation transporter [Candidatus Eremiobacteraeota bacterium]|nr:divalent metal cation transporter [Candidatus Eremiobacteraeota bacterium]MBV8720595.1 divalent metal cation transporter [Candidatus Eremiobacteraeota bacterium]